MTPESRIQDLENRLEVAERELRLLRDAMDSERQPLRDVFIARTSGAKQWQERTINAGVEEDFPDGRKCTSDSDPVALMPLASGTTVLMEVRDQGTYRYVPVGGGSATTGEFQFMLNSMVAQNVAGWDFARAHPAVV